jgi:hypothetical protein
MQQQIQGLQQQINDKENTHKIQIENINKKLSHNNDEIICLRNHNKNLLTQIKKLKNKKQGDQNLQQANQDFEKKLFEKDDEISVIPDI